MGAPLRLDRGVAGVAVSAGSVGACFDDALAEPFATFACEPVDRSRGRTLAETHLVAFIEACHNPCRRHSALGYLSPAEYERRHYPALSYPSSYPSTRTAGIGRTVRRSGGSPKAARAAAVVPTDPSEGSVPSSV